MNFGFTEEQELLRAAVQKFVLEHSPLKEVRRTAQSELGYADAVWRRMAELGWIGLLIPEAHGGAGLSWVDAVVLLEESGRGLLPSPLLSTLLAGAAIAELGSEPQKQRFLPRIARGELVATLALFERNAGLDAASVQLRASPDGPGYTLAGEKAYVQDANGAGLLVVAARAERGLGLFLVERGQAGVATESFALIDSTKRMGTLRLAGAKLGEDAVLCAPGAGEAAFARLCDAGAIAVAAEMVGAAEAAHALTVEYAKTRRQFGAAIGKFQGVKHPLAEMYVELETAKSLVYYAAWALASDRARVPRAASMAKAYATEAFSRIGIDAIQLHGAIGYTDEYDAQLYLKRSRWARPQFGDADQHYERLANLPDAGGE